MLRGFVVLLNCQGNDVRGGIIVNARQHTHAE